MPLKLQPIKVSYKYILREEKHIHRIILALLKPNITFKTIKYSTAQLQGNVRTYLKRKYVQDASGMRAGTCLECAQDASRIRMRHIQSVHEKHPCRRKTSWKSYSETYPFLLNVGRIWNVCRTGLEHVRTLSWSWAVP